MIEKTESAEDYLARLNIEGTRNVWRKNRVKIDFVLRKTRKYFMNAKTACELGVGDGYLLSRLRKLGLAVTGIDISEYCIENIREEHVHESDNIRLIVGDVTTVQLAENQFDVIACLDVLEHIPGNGLGETLCKLKRSLTDDGKIIATLPLGENLQESMVMCPKCGHRFHRIGHHHSFRDRTDVAGLFEGTFRIIETGLVPEPWFSSNFLNYVFTGAVNLIKRLTGRNITSTIYIVGEPIKPDEAQQWTKV
jgi:ubiquinone/menaquinone biosynthesis C-methylase UbiE